MELNKKSLEENLTRLLYLASILKEKHHINNNFLIDPEILSSLEIMVNNYNKFDSQVTDDVLLKFGEPIYRIMECFIAQISNELEEVYDDDENLTDLQEDLLEIDFLLKDPFLSDDEMDELLDRRNELQELIKNNS